MNRLIIVGNGFDLAHGLKTSYCDFIKDYLSIVLNKYPEKSYYEDELIEISPRDKYFVYKVPYPHPVTELTAIDCYQILKSHSNDFKINFKSKLLSETINCVENYNWVDIENEYFILLTQCKHRNTNEYDFDKVAIINSQFSYLKDLLERYLFKIQIGLSPFGIDKDILSIFKLSIKSSDVATEKTIAKQPDKSLFLNFNYTNTLSGYVSALNRIANSGKMLSTKNNINHIHGELNSLDNPIVFGFGDEYDNDYQKFETLNNNEIFKHIKSFSYFKTTNFHNLLRFIDANKFQVFIIGHSCGLSDRTMFREIFEHQNCISIKIFYHQKTDNTDDFETKTQDLARHFTNKGMMRKKIVPKPYCKPLPQYDRTSEPR